MIHRKCLTVLALLTLTLTASSQIRISGVVTDSDTGDPLPGATVQIKDQVDGVVTNRRGRFSLVVGRIPSVLLFRHIGYRTRSVVIDEVKDRVLSVALDPVVLRLDELLVSGEDPAVGIMRKVLEQKKRSRDSIRSAYAEVYTRFWLFREFKAVQMSESIRSSYWKPGAGNRELIRARRVRPPRSGTFRFARAEYVPNFYDDEVNLNGSTYVTPLHPKALEYYRFRLGKKRKRDDTIVWDIYFTPVSTTRTAFTGRLSVLDSTFVGLEIEARPHPGTEFLPPIQSHDVRFVQHFSGLPGGGRVPLDFQANGFVTFGRLGSPYPPARYEQVSSISNYAVNAPLPDSMFSDDRTQRVHPLVDFQDYLFVRNPTITPMTPREKELLSTINPLTTIKRAFRTDGFLRYYTAIDVVEKEEKDDDGPVALDEIAVRHAWFWYNRVDGWQPGVKTWWQSEQGFRVEAAVGFAMERRRLAGQLGLGRRWTGSRVRGELMLRASDSSEPVAGASRYGRFVSGLMTYAGYDEYDDFYRKKRLSVDASIANTSESLRLNVSSRLEEHSSLAKTTDDRGALITNEQRDNPLIPEGGLASVSATVSFGNPDRELVAGLEHASSDWFESEFNFTTYRARATLRMKTLFRDRERPNRLRISLFGMTSTGAPPIQRFGRVDGSIGPFAGTGVFRSLFNRSYLGYRIAALFWEHDFATVLWEKLGLWRMADSRSGLILFGAHARISRGLPESSSPQWLNEVGAALTYPFHLPLRLDFAVRLDEPGFGFRIGKVGL
jgi:Family of unknown function (DUF5686)/CarboxypepD_reg-like domain